MSRFTREFLAFRDHNAPLPASYLTVDGKWVVDVDTLDDDESLLAYFHSTDTVPYDRAEIDPDWRPESLGF